ncbi:tryptophan-rich sensory protein [uncultured Gelidibacter sp.]|uniref:tryptophan-rich sensory protein n=1 Tax=uncultured Gelidibacter sp. TaxID=259318 RepID=UPI0026071944|nr:tryptophan-rich sensory protein [uncultured Gelidibacter sp.]
MKKVLQICNGIALVSTIIINYLSNSGLLNNTTIGEVSKSLNTLFTPAGYAFAIWGFIYLLLIVFIVYQGRSLFVKVKDDDFVLRIGWWFVISCIANSAWVFLWIYGYTGLSCIFIFLLLFSLLKIVMNNAMELWDAPISVIAFLWWPFVVYSGWVAVASIVNVAAYLVKVEWRGFGMSAEAWTIFMIIVALIINLVVTWTRNMREFALVGAWALAAIAYANYEDVMSITYVAGVAALILLISSSVHAYRNRESNPLEKLKQYF